jgi:two-component system CheB/CheR fusion protein
LYRVIGTLQQPVVVLDQGRRILAANESFCHLVGVTPQSALGRSLRDVGNRLLDAPGLEEFLDLVRPPSTSADRFQFDADKGLPGWRTFTVSAQHIPEELSCGTTVVVIDEIIPPISELASQDGPAPHADQRDQLTLSSIAAADHDLRQPLQTLSLLQGILAAREKDPEQHKLIGRLEEAIGAITGMLNALAAMNQFNAGLVSPAIITFPIGLVVNRLRTELAYHADARGLEWRVVSSNVAVRSDPQLLGQVLRVLLMDAMKLIARGKVLFGCRRRGRHLVIQIWIGGTGVSAEQQENILKEFHSRREWSTGVSFVEALVKPLSDRLNLAVKTRSRPGNGLVFSAEVPIESQPAETAIRRDATSKGTILVVSDDPSVQDALTLLLREMGHEAVTATPDDGFATLLRNRSGSMRPEVVIVDFRGATELDRKVVSSLRWMFGWDIPAIVISDDVSRGEDTDVVSEPCTYLPKPIRPSELAPQVAQFLALARRRAAASKRPSHDALRQTVFVVDDDAVLRDAVRDVLQHQGQNVEAFSDSESFLEIYNRDRRGCLVIDNQLPGMAGVEVLERLKAEGSTLTSIMITGHGDISTAVRALKAGAVDYIEKPISYESLLTTIERALEIDRGAAEARIRRRELAARIAELTPRERQVMDLVVAGRSSKNIAQILKISQRTVENHRAGIMKRAGAASLPDLIRIVMQLQLSEDR